VTENSSKEWMPVPGFPGYERTRLGEYRSWRHAKGRRSAPYPIKPSLVKGYLVVYLYDAGSHKRTVSVARGVLEDKVGPCPVGMECRHLDGVKLNNSPGNLCWGTPTENTEDKRRHGTMPAGMRSGMNTKPGSRSYGSRNGSRTRPERRPRGARHANALLDEARVAKIIARLRRGERPKDIGADFGVSESCVEMIKYGYTWKHVPRDGEETV
jgi:hypothetical protein